MAGQSHAEIQILFPVFGFKAVGFLTYGEDVCSWGEIMSRLEQAGRQIADRDLEEKLWSGGECPFLYTLQSYTLIFGERVVGDGEPEVSKMFFRSSRWLRDAVPISHFQGGLHSLVICHYR